jgi:F0F1-type ATP synthase delta subunit
MSARLADIAAAFVQEVKDLPEKEFEVACSEVIQFLEKNGYGQQLTAFTKEVARALKKVDLSSSATLTTVSGDEAEAKALQKTLSTELHHDVELAETQDPSLIGGAVLTLGDERFDVSLKAALDRAAASLLSPADLS